MKKALTLTLSALFAIAAFAAPTGWKVLKEIKIASNPPPVAGTSEHARLLSLIEQQSSISKVYFDELKLLDGLWREFVLTRRMLTWDDFRDQDSN